MSEAERTTKSLIKRLISPAAAGARPDPQPVSPTIRRMRELYAERARVHTLIIDELAAQSRREAEAEAKDRDRLDAIAEAKLQGRQVDRADTDLLTTEASECRRIAKDCKAIAARLNARVAELDAEIEALENSYHAELGEFLDQHCAKLMKQYMESAGELAEIVLQVAAVRRVMFSRHTGDSNGWFGEILLPRMRHGFGGDLPPLLDAGSPEFGRLADSRVDRVRKMLQAAGFTF